MKILLTTHVFFPEHRSGTEVLTLSTAKELQRIGHNVEIWTGFQFDARSCTQQSDSYEYRGIPVHRFFRNSPPVGEASDVAESEYNNSSFAKLFEPYLSHYKPDIVHFFHLGLLSASAIDVCHNLGVPMVMTPTDFWLICPNSQLRLPGNSLCTGPDRNSVNCMKHAVSTSQHHVIKGVFNALPSIVVLSLMWGINQGAFSKYWFSPYVQALSRRAGFLRERMNKLDKMIIPTRLMETMLVNHGLLPEKVVFSRFGIQPTLRVARTRDQRGVLRIGFIGGLSEHKGAHLLISAVRLIAESLPVELKIYGNKDAFPHYVDRLIKLSEGDQRIQLCGTFPNEQIGNIFSELDVLVVPSIWYENTPLVIYSAQAAGCPVIASNLGGMSEVVEHEKNGLLFKAGDVAALSNAIERVAIDRTLLKQLADNAIKPKTISEYVTELQGIYEEVLLERRGNK